MREGTWGRHQLDGFSRVHSISHSLPIAPIASWIGELARLEWEPGIQQILWLISIDFISVGGKDPPMKDWLINPRHESKWL